MNATRKFFPPFARLALCLVLASGCATTSTLRNLDLSTLTPTVVQERVARNFEKLATFEGRARVIIEMPGSGNQGFSEVFVRLPDSLFVKTEAILGIDIGALFIDQRYFGAYAPRDNILYYGETELLDLKDFLEIELSTEELYQALTGLTLMHVDSTTTVTLERDDLLLVTRTDSSEWRYWVDPKAFVVTRSELRNAAGRPVLVKEFRRFRRRRGVTLPQIIKMTRPLARERITVYYTKQKVNHKIKPERFRLKVAKNARRVYWGSIEHPRLDRKRTN